MRFTHYEEVHVPRNEAPVLPDACPRCGAGVAKDEGVCSWNRRREYDCGGAYEYKNQIQNHTDKWWGVCPKVRVEIEEELDRCYDGALEHFHQLAFAAGISGSEAGLYIHRRANRR